ncbi:MAG: nucleotidyl transferase AbiEii/AbiGii toxin family protein [Pseudomonadota bacterium]
MATDPALRDKLALKGGTALNVFLLNLDRLSVDIDLNYVGALDRDAMLAERPALEAALHRLLAAQGYQVRRQPDEHAGGKWIARHASALGGQSVLELDINYMMRQPLFGALRMDSAIIGETRANDVLVIDRHEIVAGKLVALLDRRAARDLFDARRIFDLPGLNWSWIKGAMLAIGAAGRNDWRAANVNSIGADLQELRQKLLICLPRTQFERAGSVEAWVDETVALCRARLAPLLELNANERGFLDDVIERGVVNAGLLDLEPAVQNRIAAMPMLQWKAENVRKKPGR